MTYVAALEPTHPKGSEFQASLITYRPFRNAKPLAIDRRSHTLGGARCRMRPSFRRSIVSLAATTSGPPPAAASHALGFAGPRHGVRPHGIGACRKDWPGAASFATPGGSGPQVSGGPARAVHVERRGVMLVGDLPARGRTAQPHGGPEPQVHPLAAGLRARHVGQAMGEGDIVTRLDDRLADVS